MPGTGMNRSAPGVVSFLYMSGALRSPAHPSQPPFHEYTG
ncbi:hypothetical protein HMPREF3038_02675 [Akkermansia sp. KLE1797]|nr:hypothetical protein HMPREF3038_02675 [Akkermansia sp. KLE1797]KXU53017.1 hypothetical protein HMPREF3039_02777 [Akkermansia sp. KLE1798]KZA03657.1 hypothetical protein HMPREF1326_02634 [Akkermansia sp. KLE1605]